ncbi:MAG: replication-associated recombination protein A [Clostridiales bacterium]|nr:replication-associated recombination protein A [Clostridiales bacterium]
MDLFDLVSNASANVPLAERMRAKTLSEFLGQEHIVSETGLLRRAIKLDRLGSCIFWGPPGCGKTTLANVIANGTDGNFVKLNAVNSGVADVKKVIDEAQTNAKLYGKKTYLLLDECHRFNKTQSDSLLPAIERGDIIFIGSTTENPFASMTPAIVSRCRVFELKRLSIDNIKTALKRATVDKERGLGNYDLTIDEEAFDHIAKTSAGDLRVAFNALELAALTTAPQKDGKIRVTLKDAEESIQQKALSYDENLYYDMLSAFCKSLRGSDANAALYYMQRLIKGGCDPLLLARRLVVHSAEDVGMADPNALVVATSALTAFQNLGLPEGLIPLSEAVIYVCEAEKSNTVVEAMYSAEQDAVNVKDDNVPAHLKNYEFASKEDKKQKGLYKYPHDFGGYVEQQYLPDSLKDKVYYTPKDNGYEKTVKEIRKKKGKKV